MRNYRSRFERQLSRRWSWPPRTAAAILAAVAMTTALAAGCGSGSPISAGSGGSPSAGRSGGSPSAVAYASCIRSHGVPNYPDPGGSGLLPKGDAQHFGVSPAQFRAAQQSCRHLLPTGGSLRQQEAQCMQNAECPPALVQQMMTADLKLAQCMRSHGVPRFPDPTTNGDSSGGPYFPISSAGISEAASRAPQFVADLNECARLVGDSAPESFG